MLEIAHLGIGLRLVRILKPVAKALPILIGTVLPDVIDKSLYYGYSFITGKSGADLFLITCTRTFGHTGLFLIFLFSQAFFFKKIRNFLLLVACGVFSHQFLDLFQDFILSQNKISDSSAFRAFLFPFYKNSFSIQPTHSLSEHLFSHLSNLSMLGGEGIGFLYLLIEWRRFKKSK